MGGRDQLTQPCPQANIPTNWRFSPLLVQYQPDVRYMVIM